MTVHASGGRGDGRRPPWAPVRGRALPGSPRRVSRAVRALAEAPSSPCAGCGRVTKTTSDGICADCWAPKDGRDPRVRRPPRWALRLADLLTLRWLRR